MIWVIAAMVFIMLTAAIMVLLVDSHISAIAATTAVSLALSVLFVIYIGRASCRERVSSPV